MSRHRPDLRLIKTHLNYTVEEVARLLGVHRNTVREWLRRGLPTCDSRRPILILGRDLRAFLEARRRKNKRPCGPGQLYCVRCREPRCPDGDIAEYQPVTERLGSLVGICPTCHTMIYRRVSLAKLDRARGQLEIMMPLARRHIGESVHPIENSDFDGYREHGQDAQR